MLTKIKAYSRSPVFWELLLGSLLLLAAIIVLVVSLAKPKPTPTAPTQAVTTAPTQETTPPDPVQNPLQPEDFALVDGYLTCLTAPAMVGIDVSEWQAQVHWQQVKASGVEFVMLRAGWRGSEQGLLFEDTLAQSHYAGAKAAGLKVGAYFFSQAISTEEAAEDAAFLLEIIKDWQLDMPVVFDWEHLQDSYRTTAVDARVLTDCAKVFCDAVTKAGHQSMIYFNASLSFDRLFLKELTGYKFWLAQYDTQLNYPYRVDMWQYTETGKVPGIEGNVDIDLYFPWD